MEEEEVGLGRREKKMLTPTHIARTCARVRFATHLPPRRRRRFFWGCLSAKKGIYLGNCTTLLRLGNLPAEVDPSRRSFLFFVSVLRSSHANTTGGRESVRTRCLG